MSRIIPVFSIALILCSMAAANDAEIASAADVQPDLLEPERIEGTWLGSLSVNGREFTIIFEFFQTPKGILTATIDAPEQGVSDILVDKLTLKKGSLRIEAMNNSVFDARIKENGSAIEGHWKQAGFVLPLKLQRVSQAELDKLLEDKSYAKLFAPNELKEDLDFLFKTIEEVHPNMYAYIPEREFSKLRGQLYRQIREPISRLEFYKAIAPVVASLKNGHTFMEAPRGAFEEYLRKGGKIFPLELHWDGTAVILKSCISSPELPIGGEVLTIDNQNAKEFLIRTARYFPTENKAYSLGFLEREKNLPMFLWLEKGNSESLTLHIKTIAGSVKKYVIKALNQKEIESQAAIDKSESSSIPSRMSPAYFYRYITEHNVGLVEFNSFADLPKFRIFLDETFRKLKDQNVSTLIIDIRTNPGGSSSLGDEFLKYLTDKPFRQFETMELKISRQMCERYKWVRQQDPTVKIGSIRVSELNFIEPGQNDLRFEGEVFLLMGPITGSSAVSFAQAMKHFGIGTLVGRETEDTPVNYGEIIMNTLPHTDLLFSVACKRFVCAGAKENGRGVIPDYEVKQEPQDTGKGVDTLLQFTLDLIKKSQAKGK